MAHAWLTKEGIAWDKYGYYTYTSTACDVGGFNLFMQAFCLSVWAVAQLTGAGGANRPVTGSAKSFLRGAKIFKLCPIVLNHVCYIFPGEPKNYSGGFAPPAPL